MRAAIMQPTYLPWIGYFGLMDCVDVFVLLDSVQFARRSWQQRNRIKTPDGPSWLTVPVLSKGQHDQLIQDVVVDTSHGFPEDHIRAIELNYKKAPYFEMYAPSLFAILRSRHKNLAQLNEDLIVWGRETLGITTLLKRSSELKQHGVKAELLASLCDELRATEYISPPSSRDYLDESDAFQKHGIPFTYFEFEHPEYEQRFGEFVPYMSIIDLLFNVGPESLGVIRTGQQASQQNPDF